MLILALGMATMRPGTQMGHGMAIASLGRQQIATASIVSSVPVLHGTFGQEFMGARTLPWMVSTMCCISDLISRLTLKAARMLWY